MPRARARKNKGRGPCLLCAHTFTRATIPRHPQILDLKPHTHKDLSLSVSFQHPGITSLGAERHRYPVITTRGMRSSARIKIGPVREATRYELFQVGKADCFRLRRQYQQAAFPTQSSKTALEQELLEQEIRLRAM